MIVPLETCYVRYSKILLAKDNLGMSYFSELSGTINLGHLSLMSSSVLIKIGSKLTGKASCLEGK